MSQSCSACDPGSCGKPADGTVLMKKIEYMIGDNYTLIFILFLVLGILGLALYYFIKSLKDTLVNYYNAKKKVETESTGDDPRKAKDDNYTYHPTPKEDPEKQGSIPIPGQKGTFATDLEKRYEEVNKQKAEYIRAQYNGKENDDPIDQRTLFKGHDNYSYERDKL